MDVAWLQLYVAASGAALTIWKCSGSNNTDMSGKSAAASPPGDPSVVVVGAGPTGLLLAAELARRDVDCLLIDAHDAPLGWDRATVVHARSIEIFEALGLVDRFLDEGVKVRGARLRSDGQPLGEMNLGLADSRYGFDLGVSEEFTESVLTDYLEDHGGGGDALDPPRGYPRADR